MKVCVEIAAMAADAGMITPDKDVIVIAGSGRGSDTAVVIRPANSHNLFDTVIKEVIAKPSNCSILKMGYTFLSLLYISAGVK